MFGGTPVIATGPSFSTSDTISCHYGDIKVEHIYISNEQILCVSPSFNKIGEIILVVYVTANNGVTTTFGSTFSSSELMTFEKCIANGLPGYSPIDIIIEIILMNFVFLQYLQIVLM